MKKTRLTGWALGAALAGFLACAEGPAPSRPLTPAEEADASAPDAPKNDAALEAGDPPPEGDSGPPEGDGALPDDAGQETEEGGALPSLCKVDPGGVSCAHALATIAGRKVAYAFPPGEPPPGGWPTVVYFHGSLDTGEAAFVEPPFATFGRYQLALTVKALLDRGYAVVAPNAGALGVWESNIPPYALLWSSSTDDVFMRALFKSMEEGKLGPLDPNRRFAMGISSGGFMTSRMAVSYAGMFRALVDHSGSYATCSTTCFVSTPLPADHPPTLFLRGAFDTIVPDFSVQPYLTALLAEGHEAKLVVDLVAGHEWLALGVTAIPEWFDAHP